MEQMRHFETLAGIAHKQLHALTQCALVHPDVSSFPHIRIHFNFEDMGNHVQSCVGQGLEGSSLVTLTLDKCRQIAFGRVGQKPDHDVKQLRHTCAAVGAGKTHRHQVSAAQSGLKRIMQTLGIDIALL